MNVTFLLYLAICSDRLYRFGILRILYFQAKIQLKCYSCVSILLKNIKLDDCYLFRDLLVNVVLLTQANMVIFTEETVTSD